MVPMNTDERDRQYFALQDRIKLQQTLIFRMQENGALRVSSIEDWDEQDIASAILERELEIERRVLADLEREMRLL